MAGTVAFLMWQQMQNLDRARLMEAVAATPVEMVLIAAILTVFSLVAAAGFDVLGCRQLGVRVPVRRATEGGLVAVTLGQSLGFGLLTGCMVRWLCLRGSGVSLPQAAALSAAVAAGFLAGLIAVLSVTGLMAAGGIAEMTGLSASAVRMTALLGAGLTAILWFLAAYQPNISVLGRKLSVPSPRMFLAQISLAVLDLVPAAIALWVLIPGQVAPELWVFVPIYLFAFGVGMMSNLPGGLGAIEFTCLVAMPSVPPEQLLAALIVYRGIYYAAPAMLGAVLLALRLGRDEPAAHVVPAE